MARWCGWAFSLTGRLWPCPSYTRPERVGVGGEGGIDAEVKLLRVKGGYAVQGRVAIALAVRDRRKTSRKESTSSVQTSRKSVAARSAPL